MIQERLFALQDEKYREFQRSLIPGLPRENIIGIRIPAMRKLAKEFVKEPEAAVFLKQLPHTYYDENILHALLIAEIKDYDACMEAVEAFLPYIDNWAVCDGLSPKAFGKHKAELLEKIRLWIPSEHTYTCRFGIGMLMRWFLDEDFQPGYLELPAAVRSEEYYVNMMTAWFFATALAKQWDAAIPYLEQNRLDPWTHNKTIQKARESYRITTEQKEYLKRLKVIKILRHSHERSQACRKPRIPQRRNGGILRCVHCAAYCQTCDPSSHALRSSDKGLRSDATLATKQVPMFLPILYAVSGTSTLLAPLR